MIRWVERADSYRLSVNRLEEGLAYAMLGLGVGLLGVSMGTYYVAGFIAPLLLLRGLVSLSQRGWIDVPLRGGPVRWQGGWRQPIEPVEVRRFEVSAVPLWLVPSLTRHILIAVLHDGRTLEPLRGMSASDPGIVDRMAMQLNEALGASHEEEHL